MAEDNAETCVEHIEVCVRLPLKMIRAARQANTVFKKSPANTMAPLFFP